MLFGVCTQFWGLLLRIRRPPMTMTEISGELRTTGCEVIVLDKKRFEKLSSP